MGKHKSLFQVKRLLAVALAVTMAVVSVPVTVQAAPGENQGQEVMTAGTEGSSAQGNMEAGEEETQKPSGDAAGDPADSAQAGDAQQTPEETGKQEDAPAEEDSEPDAGNQEGDSALEDSESETEKQEEDSALEDSESESEKQEETLDAGDVEEDAAQGEAEETLEEPAVAKETQVLPLTSADDIASGSYAENGSDVSWVIDKDGKLTVTGTGDFAESGRSREDTKIPWKSYQNRILSAEINVKGMTDASYMFNDCYSLKSVDVSGFDTGSVTDMSYMFSECHSLTDLDVSGFDTGKVTNMSYMFNNGCGNVTELDVSGFDTGSVTNMSHMFNNGSLNGGVTKLNVSGFNTGSVTDMSYMFSGCKNVTELDVSGFDTGKVTDMSGMFNGCSNVTELDVSGFNTGSVTNMSYMFNNGSVTELNVSGFKTGNVTDMSSMFGGCGNLTALDVSGFDTSNVTDMSNMFYSCRSLSKLDVSGFNTGSVTDMSSMFCYCDTLKSIDVSGFKTGNVTDMSYMFTECDVTELDLSGFDTSNVTDMQYMFRDCRSLTSMDISNFDTSKVTYIKDGDWIHSGYDWMFCDCRSLKYLNIGFVMNLSSLDDGETSGTEPGIINFLGGTSPEIIYTPRNLQKSVRLPVEEGVAWYDNKGTSYRELPQRKTQSIVLVKNKPSADAAMIVAVKSRMVYRCGELLNTDDLTVYHYDAKGTVTPVTEGYTTNAAEIDMSVPGKKILEVTYQDMSAEIEITVETFYTVTFDGNGKDDIARGTKNEVKESADYTFTLVKAKGYSYEVTAVMGEESIMPTVNTAGNIYTIPDVTANLVITIHKTADQPQEPEKKTCMVTFEGTGKDDIAAGTPKEVKEGENYTFTLIKVEGYAYTVTAVMGMQSVTLSVDATGNIYTISDVTADLIITISKTAGQTPDVPDLPEEDRTGLKIKFVHEEDVESIYTGKAIQPEIRVYYNGKILIAGVDYTVKYTDNIRAGMAKISVTGKGNFSKANNQTTFRIVEKNISDSNLTLCGAGADADGKETVKFANASRLTPILYYNNSKLTNKDYVVKSADGNEITNKKLGSNDNNTVIKIVGKPGGNFTGSREVILHVVDKKDLKKFGVTVDKNKTNTVTYNGGSHYIHEIGGALTVTARDENKTKLEYGKDFAVVYQNDLISAGAKKFTVVGMGLYTGSVSKSYTVKPAKDEALTIQYDGSTVSGNKINGSFTFVGAGVTIGDKLTITGSDGILLREGKDYKLTYSGNKKANPNAKCTVSFLGNYKGHSKITLSYEIGKADLGGTDVVIADQLYKNKPGIYKSVPYVIEDKLGANSLLKPSNYKITYYTQDPTNNNNAVQMKGANKVGDGDTVWVKLEAKGNYTGTKIVSYKIRSAKDLSKARITFQDADGKTVKNAVYTGSGITESQMRAVVDGVLAENEKDDIEVIYVDNIKKGKATVIIKATGRDGCKYVGSKKATFSIVARNLD